MDDDDDDDLSSNPYAKFFKSYRHRTNSRRDINTPTPKKLPAKRPHTTSGIEASRINFDNADDNNDSPQKKIKSSNNNVDDSGNNTTPTIPSTTDIPQEHIRIIRHAMEFNFGISSPHDEQLQAINRGAFYDGTVMNIIAKTAFGKSVIPSTICSLRRGIAVILVPLLGLGSDQVNKTMIIEKNIESYHIDEHRLEDATLLRERLRSLTAKERENISIQLYLSPLALAEGSEWMPILRNLAQKDFICLLCIDEAHYIEQQGRCFRPEFNVAVEQMKVLYDMMPIKGPVIAMSATYRKVDQQTVAKKLGLKPNFIIWTDMGRRDIFFEVVVSGNPTMSVQSCLAHDYSSHRNIQTIIYTNSKKKAESSLVSMAENVLEKNCIQGEVMPITGSSGLMEKTFVMEAFARPFNVNEEEDDGDNIYATIVPATAAANAGISSKRAHRCYRIGPPLSMYDIAQEMGRVARLLDPLCSDRYEIHLSYPLVISLYVRIQQQPNKDERNKQLESFYEVLRYLLIPNKCFHSGVESYFGEDTNSSSNPCRDSCSFCTGIHKELTGEFNKRKLVGLLTTEFFNGVAPKHDKFTKFVKDKRNDIFEEGQAPGKLVGPIHALCLQLIAKGLVELDINTSEKKYVGTDKLQSNHVVIRAGVTNIAGYKEMAMYNDSLWSGLTYV